jgi:probable rRNA maturation factor
MYCPSSRARAIRLRRARSAFCGDIVISLDTLERNVKSYGVEADEELKRLLIHGILHLSGMDHGEEESDPMLELQEKTLRDLIAAGKAVIE